MTLNTLTARGSDRGYLFIFHVLADFYLILIPHFSIFWDSGGCLFIYFSYGGLPGTRFLISILIFLWDWGVTYSFILFPVACISVTYLFTFSISAMSEYSYNRISSNWMESLVHLFIYLFFSGCPLCYLFIYSFLAACPELFFCWGVF